MDPFQEYRFAHDELEADREVAALWDAVVEAQRKHDLACIPYRERMSAAEAVIIGAVLEQGKSVTLHNIEARYMKGRSSTSWKSVAEEIGAPPEIVAKHTKEGEPSVMVRAL
ncbi:MAG: hypothetical protein MUO37_12190 [Methyloceanibacter sp.]|nr:hypothetical protein [Methyloceanibacter sp.]